MNYNLEISNLGENNTNKQLLTKVVNPNSDFTSLKNQLEINADPISNDITLPAGNNYNPDEIRIQNSQEMVGSTEGFPNQVENKTNIENSGEEAIVIQEEKIKTIFTKVVSESIDSIQNSENKYKVTGLYQVNEKDLTGVGEGKTRIEASNAAKKDAENKYKFGL